MNNQNTKILLMIGIVLFVVLIIGVTYAFYTVSTNINYSNNTVVIEKIGNRGLATLRSITSSLKLIVNNNDMSLNNTGEYYADDEKNLVTTLGEGMHNIVNLSITGGDENVDYSCSADIKVILDNKEGSMGSMLDSNDLELYLNGGSLSETLDLSKLKTNGSKTYKVTFRMTGNEERFVEGYIKLNNKETSQVQLANKQLEVKIESSNLNCDIINPVSGYGTMLEGEKNLSKEIVGGMYRYQGTEVDNNYICFGTINKNDCTSEDGIDKYLYRIIGITESNQLKLIKETFIKSGSTLGFSWHNKSTIDSSSEYYCEPDGVCPDWPGSLLFKRLNGISNGSINLSGNNNGGNSDIFIDNPTYDYLKSGDGINGGTSKSEWYNKVSDYAWKYGEIRTNGGYNGNTVYAIENLWRNRILSKIGLMCLHDYFYAYTDGNPQNAQNAANSWIYFRKDKKEDGTFYNTTGEYEWLMSKFGFNSNTNNSILAYGIYLNNIVNAYVTYSGIHVRPVFYLKSNIKLSGSGVMNSTVNDPYIITN